MPLRGRLSPQPDRFLLLTRHAFAVVVEVAEEILSVWIALLGGTS